MAIHPLHRFSHAPRRNRGRGFTLLELVMAGTVVGLLAAIALPSFANILARQKVQQCARDMMLIAQSIERYRTLNFKLPEQLSDLGSAPPKDPWGQDYRYLNFGSPAPGVKGKIRKDHNLHPLNSQFDLYSVGKDGRTAAPLTAKASRDDVIWARDGGFIGLATDY